MRNLDFGNWTNAQLVEWLIAREWDYFSEQLAGERSEFGKFLVELDRRWSEGSHAREWHLDQEDRDVHYEWLRRRRAQG